MSVRLGICLILMAVGLVLRPAPSLAATCDDVEFADSTAGPGGTLVLNGLGLRKATFLKVKVYVAGLYMPTKSPDAEAILHANGPWRLDLHFVHDVDASDMTDAFHEGFENTGADLTPHKARIESLVGMFVDFKEGDVLSFISDPASGVAVHLNDATKGTIEGSDFAAMLLAIWLGPNPPNEEIKSGLLGGACE